MARHCKTCLSDLVTDGIARHSAGFNSTEDVICVHCDAGEPVTFTCDYCEQTFVREPVRHPEYDDEAFCSESCRKEMDELAKLRDEDEDYHAKLEAEMRLEDMAIEQARKDGKI